ncbi:MAG: phosphate uptake regulator PhoU [Candidatus Marinimicrobia bacterium]|nr:phosphate uptake regulator PhoU [Candidatus Neomarinimicrobiota bacterium]MCF7903874.1 phosphate uptake regulator PhoU [Candidatus Neomarinimicrobiota bacterium]
MWKELKQIWFGDDLLSEAWDMTYEALNIDSEMFDDAVTALWGDSKIATQKLIFKKDKLINKYERDIRRKIITHLSVQQGEGLAAGMVLSTVIVDVERIGDYIKNIVDLTEMHPGDLKDKDVKQVLNEMENSIKNLFKVTRECVEDGDEDIALELYYTTKELGRMCDENIRDILTSGKSYESNSTVYALYFRYLKRISAHLRNIVSSVINPYDRIGYKPKNV